MSSSASGNTKYGSGALQNNTVSNSNSSAFGICALRDSTNVNNTAVGAYSATYTSTGQGNVSLGTNSLLQNTLGNYNTALGTAAMCLTETGSSNTSIGACALQYNNADSNTAVGCLAGFNVTTGARNTLLGSSADVFSNDIENSTAIGYNAKATDDYQIMMGTTEQVVIPGSAVLTNTDAGSYSSSTSIVPKSYVDSLASGLVPTSSCQCATTGFVNLSTGGLLVIDGYQTVAGDRVLVKTQDGSNANIQNGIYNASSGAWTRASDCAVGANVKGQLTFIENGTANGYKAFSQIASPAIVGTDPLQYTLFYSTGFTLGNGLQLTGNSLNVKNSLSGFLTFLGVNSGSNTAYSMDTGATANSDVLVNGVRIGRGGLNDSTNTTVGSQALGSSNTGRNNSAVGSQALQLNTSGASNTALGAEALRSNTQGTQNAALGYRCLRYNTTGGNNVAVGAQALDNLTIGSDNIAIGYLACANNISGNANVAIGTKALYVATGTNSTALGYLAGLNSTGSNNTFLGSWTDCTTATFSNSTAIGYNAKATASNQICMGTSTEQVFVPGTLSVTGGSTFNGNVVVNTAGNNAAPVIAVSTKEYYGLRIKDNTSSNYIAFYPYAGQSSLNNCVSLGDCMIAALNNTQSTSTLTLTTWASGSYAGINIKPYYVQMRGQTNLDYSTYNNGSATTSTYTVPTNFKPWLFIKSDYNGTAVVTVLLPSPSATYIGAILNIRRQPTQNFQLTLTTSTSINPPPPNVMVPDNSPTPTGTINLPNTVYYVQMTCDGTYWYVLVKNQV